MNDFISGELEVLQQLIEFNKTKEAFFASQDVRAPHESVAPYISQLNQDGIVMIPGFLSEEQCQSICRNKPDQEEFTLSTEDDKSMFYLNAARHPAFADFFEDPRTVRIMKGYIGENAVPLRQSMEIRTVKGSVHAFNRMFHMDSWKPRVKAFLYLHDVTTDDAPVVYLKGSHKGDWRLPMEYKTHTLYQTSETGYAKDLDVVWVGCYWPYEVNEIKKKHGLQEQVCTGKAGTLVVFDARGLHKATELINDHRYILINHYIAEGHNT
ncbi:phytanoyl-CoA dioxygenase family protein [Roseateles sp. DB2]|uniref:phytanoyl-CoA dioxygenase family protein n=1 Tax=Roseateles sp. DB2 TaxID=3453717 RepID=UPI003EEFD625